MKRSLLMGAFYSPVGIVIGVFVWRTAVGEGYQWFPVYAGVAAFLASCFFWWLFVERKKRSQIRFGVIAGTMSGLLSHYVCWYLQIIGSNIQYWLFDSFKSTLGEPPIDLLNGLWGALSLSLWSWLFLGWITIPLGALIGGLFIWYLNRKAVLV